jgi:hypothetical protein
MKIMWIVGAIGAAAATAVAFVMLPIGEQPHAARQEVQTAQASSEFLDAARSSFEESFKPSCAQSAAAGLPANHGVIATIARYCECLAGAVAADLTIEELSAALTAAVDNSASAVFATKIEKGAGMCAHTLG